MSLAQDLRNAWDFRDRDEFERLLLQLPERQPDPSPHRHDVGQGMFGHVLCSHTRATRTIGPTTDQVNWYCMDCRHTWTTFPGRPVCNHERLTTGLLGNSLNAVPMCADCGTHDVGEVTASGFVVVGNGLPTYQQSGRPLGMVGTVGNQSEPGNQSNLPDGTSV